MKLGKITKVLKDRGFFYIDNDYWCHFKSIDWEPKEGDMVEYDQEKRHDGKNNALNVKYSNPLAEYFDELEEGYFASDDKKNLKPQLIIYFPRSLAEIFQTDKNINKSTQIRKYFDNCRLIEGKYKLTKDFGFVKTELLKLIPLLNNAKSKGHISDDFFNFFERNIQMAIESEDHFLYGFMVHFQSIIGYYKN